MPRRAAAIQVRLHAKASLQGCDVNPAAAIVLVEEHALNDDLVAFTAPEIIGMIEFDAVVGVIFNPVVKWSGMGSQCALDDDATSCVVALLGYQLAESDFGGAPVRAGGEAENGEADNKLSHVRGFLWGQVATGV